MISFIDSYEASCFCDILGHIKETAGDKKCHRPLRGELVLLWNHYVCPRHNLKILKQVN